MVVFNILDYKGRKTPVELNLDDIGRIDLTVLSGDEILTIVKKDFTIEKIDSSSTRLMGYPDGEYTVYAPAEGINLLDDQGWLNRDSSYSY